MKNNKYEKELQELDLIERRLGLAFKLKDFKYDFDIRGKKCQIFSDEWIIKNIMKYDIKDLNKNLEEPKKGECGCNC
jgi:hypothetical protein